MAPLCSNDHHRLSLPEWFEPHRAGNNRVVVSYFVALVRRLLSTPQRDLDEYARGRDALARLHECKDDVETV